MVLLAHRFRSDPALDAACRTVIQPRIGARPATPIPPDLGAHRAGPLLDSGEQAARVYPARASGGRRAYRRAARRSRVATIAPGGVRRTSGGVSDRRAVATG